MIEENSENAKLKKYLLGLLESYCEQIEERLMTDDGYFQALLIEEDELIREYVDGNLSEKENLQFETHFLISDERRKKLHFVRALQRKADEFFSDNKPQKIKETEKIKPVNFFTRFFSAPFPVAAGFLVVFCLSAFLVWNFYLRSDNSELALVSLNKAFKNERPLESRISAFEYAPKTDTRGGAEEKINTIELNRAENLILQNASENANAENLHALGRLYLAKKQFDEATKHLEKSEKLAPQNAQIQNDLGVAYLEKAKMLDKDKGAQFELYGKALNRFEKAAAENPKLSEAKFNQALALQIYLPRQAVKAWREYLELDPNSIWAEEARRNLQKLESQYQDNLSSDQLKEQFFQAYEQRDEQKAYELLSKNREIILGNHLAQNLIKFFLEAEEKDREHLINMLNFAGETEKKKSGDFFLSDVAAYFTKVKKNEEFQLNKSAHNLLNKGFELCLAGDFSAALTKFQESQKQFSSVGNEPQAKIAEYFGAYSLFNINELNKANEIWLEVEKFSARKKYKWLYVNDVYWIGHYQNIAEEFTKASETLEKGLAVSEEIGDSFMVQRFLSTLAIQNSRIGKKQDTLKYLQKLFEESAKNESSLRQKWRNYSYALEIIAAFELKEFAGFVAEENILIAGETKEPLFIADSRNDAGIVFYNKGDFETARTHLSQVAEKLRDVKENASRTFLDGRSTLVFAHLERKAKNYEKSAEFYEKALNIFREIENNPYSYETQKGRLLTQIELGNDAELEKQIPQMIETAEKYRKEIFEEQQRAGFFDSEQTIYDIAVEYEFKKGETEKAYNYLEISNSRSLLDWLSKGAEVKKRENQEIEIFLNETVAPSDLTEIRAQMPENVQIVQYAVLEKKILIWLISKEKAEVFPVEIEAEKLSEKVKTYLKLLPDQNEESQYQLKQISRELYDILINPLAGKLDEKKEICLIPHKILFHLPFAALETSEGDPFIKKFDVFYSPSANVFLLCTKNAGNKNKFSENEKLLSIGNPAFDKTQFPDLQNLPAAETEARKIAAFYDDTQILTGENATRKNLLESLSDAEIFHFAGHYVVEQNSPLSSSLILAESDVLSNADLIGKKLEKTKLVIVSACDSGVEKYYKGEGLVGLSRTFLAAGVPVVVASQWKVDSDAAAELMTRFHKLRRTENLPTAKALRRAQLDLLENKRFENPYFWAAFAQIGGYAEF